MHKAIIFIGMQTYMLYGAASQSAFKYIIRLVLFALLSTLSKILKFLSLPMPSPRPHFLILKTMRKINSSPKQPLNHALYQLRIALH
jgi:hypothetical protein